MKPTISYDSIQQVEEMLARAEAKGVEGKEALLRVDVKLREHYFLGLAGLYLNGAAYPNYTSGMLEWKMKRIQKYLPDSRLGKISIEPRMLGEFFPKLIDKKEFPKGVVSMEKVDLEIRQLFPDTPR